MRCPLRMTGALRIGCSSWTSNAWLGKVYPEAIRHEDRLAAYASLFDAVEIDATYHRPPNPFVMEGWKAKTPANFRFALKLTRDYVDPRKPVDGARLAYFTEAAKLLGEKLGPILLQFAPWVKPGRAATFLYALLDELDPSLRYAVEFRDPGWYSGETGQSLIEALSTRDVALVWSCRPNVAVPPALTSDFVYLRFAGDLHTIPREEHGEIRVDRTTETRVWASRLKSRLSEVQEAFVVFNDDFAGFAPESADLFRRELESAPLRYHAEISEPLMGASAFSSDLGSATLVQPAAAVSKWARPAPKLPAPGLPGAVTGGPARRPVAVCGRLPLPRSRRVRGKGDSLGVF